MSLKDAHTRTRIAHLLPVSQTNATKSQKGAYPRSKKSLFDKKYQLHSHKQTEKTLMKQKVHYCVLL